MQFLAYGLMTSGFMTPLNLRFVIHFISCNQG
jgi:hypothetical protein